MTPSSNPGELLRDLVPEVATVGDFAAHFQALLADVYADNTLAPEREVLYRQTLDIHKADESLVNDVRLKLILKVRVCMQRLLDQHKGGGGVFQPDEGYVAVRQAVFNLLDGDLAMRTRLDMGGRVDEHRMLGLNEHEPVFHNLRYSPEAQSESEYDFSNNKYLTEESQVRNAVVYQRRFSIVTNGTATSPKAQVVILNGTEAGADASRIALVFQYDDFTPEVLSLINADPLLALVLKSKTDPEAELELIEMARSSANTIHLKALGRRLKLHTRESFDSICQGLLAIPNIVISRLLESNPNAEKWLRQP